MAGAVSGIILFNDGRDGVINCNRIFKFGPSKIFCNNMMLDIPVIGQIKVGREDVLRVQSYIRDI